MRLAALILCGCVVGFTGCGPKLGSNDLAALEKGAAALESLGAPDQIARMLEMLMGELELGHSEACRKRYTELANSAPDMRASLAAQIIDGCGVKCPSNLARLGSMGEAERWKSILAECPGGPLGGDGLRLNMSAVEYAVLRQLYVVDLKAALDKDGSERAKALGLRYDKLLGRRGRLRNADTWASRRWPRRRRLPDRSAYSASSSPGRARPWRAGLAAARSSGGFCRRAVSARDHCRPGWLSDRGELRAEIARRALGASGGQIWPASRLP